MKTTVLIVSLFFSLASLAQGKSNHNKNKGNEGKHNAPAAHGMKPAPKPHGDGPLIKVEIGQDRKGHPGNKGSKGNTKHHNNAHQGNGNAYGKNKGNLSGREFGQQRAAEARSKHHPRNQADALITIRIFRRENILILGDIQRKILLANRNLEDLFKRGSITRTVYLQKKSRLGEFERREQLLKRTIPLPPRP